MLTTTSGMRGSQPIALNQSMFDGTISTPKYNKRS